MYRIALVSVAIFVGAAIAHAAPDGRLSAPAEERIAAMAISRESGAQLLDAYLVEQRRIRALAPEERRAALAEQRRAARRLAVEAE
jgi:hypothetical protein